MKGDLSLKDRPPVEFQEDLRYTDSTIKRPLSILQET